MTICGFARRRPFKCFSWSDATRELFGVSSSSDIITHPPPPPSSGELRTQKLKSHLVRNTKLKSSSFKAYSRSVHSRTCYAYCQGFLPCLFLPFRSIFLHCFQNLSRFLLCWLWITHGSCVGLQNKIGHPAGCRFPY